MMLTYCHYMKSWQRARGQFKTFHGRIARFGDEPEQLFRFGRIDVIVGILS